MTGTLVMALDRLGRLQRARWSDPGQFAVLPNINRSIVTSTRATPSHIPRSEGSSVATPDVQGHSGLATLQKKRHFSHKSLVKRKRPAGTGL